MIALLRRHRFLAPARQIEVDRFSPLEPVRKRRRPNKTHQDNAPPSTVRHILTLPTEIRLRIYEFCFPSSNRQVQLIPYYVHDPRCHLNLPLNIYLVCKKIYHELPPLHIKLRSLDFTFVIRSEYVIGLPPPYFFGNIANNDHGADDDAKLTHFTQIIRYAVRVRIICSGIDILTTGIPLTRSELPSQINLPRSALRILEIEIRPFCLIPPEWNCVDVIKMPGLARTIVHRIFWPLLGPFLKRLDNLQINMHEDDRFDTYFESIIREHSRPCIPKRAITEHIEGFRGECFAALIELLAWFKPIFFRDTVQLINRDIWIIVRYWFDFWLDIGDIMGGGRPGLVRNTAGPAELIRLNSLPRYQLWGQRRWEQFGSIWRLVTTPGPFFPWIWL